MLFTNVIYAVSVLVFSVVAFFFPSLFVSVGEIPTKQFILPLLMLIMFGMGMHVSVAQFKQVLTQPKFIVVGLVAQFSIMPLVGFAIASTMDLPAEILAGIILVGCSPSGLASNVMCFIAKANLALSLTLTSLATLVAPLLTPLLMQLLASELVIIDPIAMFTSMLKLVVVPVALGLLVQQIPHTFIDKLKAGMPMISMLGIIFIVAVIIANGQASLRTMGIGLVLAVIAHNLVGYALGYTVAAVAGADEQSRRTLAFEVGLQNSGLATGLALAMNKLSTMGLAPALFSAVQNISAAGLAAYWKSHLSTERYR